MLLEPATGRHKLAEYLQIFDNQHLRLFRAVQDRDARVCSPQESRGLQASAS